MRHRLIPPAALVLLVLLALLAASTSAARASVSGSLTVIGPWKGRDAASFNAVLAGFTEQNPSVSVTYKTVNGDVAQALRRGLQTGTPDLAVLSLPTDQKAMVSMAQAGTLQPIGFAAPTVNAQYAWSWKKLGSVDGKLTALLFKATDRSAFWYDTSAFANLKLSAPSSWSAFMSDVSKIRNAGLSPFAISGGSRIALPHLFESLYLTFQGNKRYDMLADGKLKWTDPSVGSTLRIMKQVFGASTPVKLTASYATAVHAVFGSPAKAYMLPGGSDALATLSTTTVSNRPLSQFSSFAFPRVGRNAPPRVIGDANGITMVNDSPAARALISYLASSDAAAIWAKRGGDFLSPNRNVAEQDYSVPQLGQLAHQLTSATTFRYGLASMQGRRVTKALGLQLANLLAGNASRNDVMLRLAAAAGQT